MRGGGEGRGKKYWKRGSILEILRRLEKGEKGRE